MARKGGGTWCAESRCVGLLDSGGGDGFSRWWRPADEDLSIRRAEFCEADLASTATTSAPLVPSPATSAPARVNSDHRGGRAALQPNFRFERQQRASRVHDGGGECCAVVRQRTE